MFMFFSGLFIGVHVFLGCLLVVFIFFWWCSYFSGLFIGVHVFLGCLLVFMFFWVVYW